MKLNIGCGLSRKEGFINVDISPDVKPDMVLDVCGDWPWDDGQISEVHAIHVLEHLVDLNAFMVEAHRCMAVGAQMFIAVPHPRCDLFIGDPTHVRPIDENVLRLYDREQCEEWQRDGFANTPLALMLGVDFKLLSANGTVADEFHHLVAEDPKKLAWYAKHMNNVIVQLEFVLERR